MSVPMEGDLGLSFDSEAVRKTYDAWADPLASPARGDGEIGLQPNRPRVGIPLSRAGDRRVGRAVRAGAVRLPKRGARVLDVGCADGLQAESLSSAGVLAGEDSRVCGIDFSERLLADARGAGRYHSLVCDDLNRCDADAEIDVATARFEDDAFHVSFCVGVLTYVDPDAYAAATKRETGETFCASCRGSPAARSSSRVARTCARRGNAPRERWWMRASGDRSNHP